MVHLTWEPLLFLGIYRKTRLANILVETFFRGFRGFLFACLFFICFFHTHHTQTDKSLSIKRRDTWGAQTSIHAVFRQVYTNLPVTQSIRELNYTQLKALIKCKQLNYNAPKLPRFNIIKRPLSSRNRGGLPLPAYLKPLILYGLGWIIDTQTQRAR